MRANEAIALMNAINTDLKGIGSELEYKVTHTKGVNGYSIKRKNMVKKINMMSGKEFLEDEDTPYYCSPSSETYWSM
jgi:hypothetical protein